MSISSCGRPAARFISMRSSSDAIRTEAPASCTTSAWRRKDLGSNTQAYCATLQAVQGGSYQPERDAAPFVRLCVEAHVVQARRRLRQLAEAGARWAYLEKLVEQRHWPVRLVIALEQSLFQGTDRAAYAAEADVSAPTASSDLRRLLDAGLISQRGKGPATRYVASEQLAHEVGGHLRRGPSNP